MKNKLPLNNETFFCISFPYKKSNKQMFSLEYISLHRNYPVMKGNRNPWFSPKFAPGKSYLAVPSWIKHHLIARTIFYLEIRIKRNLIDFKQTDISEKDQITFYVLHVPLWVPDWKNLYRLSEWLYNGAPLRAPLETLNNTLLRCSRGFRVALNWVPMMPRDASFSDSW